MPKVAKFTQNQVNPVVRQPNLSAPITQQVDNTIPRAAQGFLNEIQNQLVSYEDSKAEEAITNFESEKNNLLFTGDNAFFNTRGENAYKGQQLANEGLDKLRNKLAEDLSPNARRKFMTASSSRLNTAKLSIFRHGAKGLDEFDTATRKATVTNSFETAALNFSDSNIVDSQREIGLRSVKNSAIKNGLPGKEAEESFISLFNSHIIKAAADNDVELAEQMYSELEGSFESHKDKQDTRDYIDKKKVAANVKLEANNVSDLAFGIISNNPDDLFGAMSKIDTLDSDIRTKVRREVFAQQNALKKAKSQVNSQIVNDGRKAFVEGGVNGFDQWVANNWEQYDRLPENTKTSLSKLGEVVTPEVLSTQLMSAKAEGDKKQVQELVDLYGDSISVKDRQSLDLFLNTDDNYDAPSLSLPMIKSATDSFQGDTGRQKKNKFNDALLTWTESYYTNFKKNANKEEIRQHLKDMVAEEESSFFGNTKFYETENHIEESLISDSIDKMVRVSPNNGSTLPQMRESVSDFKNITGRYPGERDFIQFNETMEFILDQNSTLNNDDPNEFMLQFLRKFNRFPSVEDLQGVVK